MDKLKQIDSTAAAISSVFIVAFIGVGVVVYYASNGEVWATGLLFSIWTLLCLIIGAAIAIISIRTFGNWNKQENMEVLNQQLGAMSQGMKTMNAYNQAMQQQMRYPGLQEGGGVWTQLESVNSPVFDELRQQK